MKDKRELDDMRQQIQDSLRQSKRDELRDKFGMQAEYTNPKLPPEEEISWLDSVLEFERQFENVKTITVRERIGNPELKPLAEIPLYALEQAVTDLLDLFTQEREYFPFSFDKQPLFDMAGEPITAVSFRNQIEAVWQYLPATNKVLVEPVTVLVEGDEGMVTAVITWHNNENQPIGQVESTFRLQPSPYTGWDTVQTSLLNDLLRSFTA
jgi:hypothetical protein